MPTDPRKATTEELARDNEGFLTSDDLHTVFISGRTFQNKAIEYAAVDGLAVFEGDIIVGTVDEMERIRLHAYQTERILSRVDPLRHLARDAASHHEYCDGSGYHKQLTAEQMTLGQRILAIADYYATLVKPGACAVSTWRTPPSPGVSWRAP